MAGQQFLAAFFALSFLDLVPCPILFYNSRFPFAKLRLGSSGQSIM
jgi:hypothetical protein